MAYRTIAYDHIRDPVLNEVFEHANVYLRDVYSMLVVDPAHSGGGPCNFSIALVLLCLIDGLARDVYPTMSVPDQGTRFRNLIRDKMPWATDDDRWIDRARAANVFYLELRNPIAHELAQDKATSARPHGYLDPAVVKTRPGRSITVDEIDALSEWSREWPVLSTVTRPNGRSRYVLDCGALYWATKAMVTAFSTDSPLLAHAVETRYSTDASQGSFYIGKIEEKLSRWADLQKEIRRVWLFGSRCNGSNELGSSLDIAIELINDAVSDEALREPQNTWADVHHHWLRELGRLFRLPLNMQQHDPGRCPVVCAHVDRLVFARS